MQVPYARHWTRGFIGAQQRQMGRSTAEAFAGELSRGEAVLVALCLLKDCVRRSDEGSLSRLGGLLWIEDEGSHDGEKDRKAKNGQNGLRLGHSWAIRGRGAVGGAL